MFSVRSCSKNCLPDRYALAAHAVCRDMAVSVTRTLIFETYCIVVVKVAQAESLLSKWYMLNNFVLLYTCLFSFSFCL
jgi:hypothetical protein